MSDIKAGVYKGRAVKGSEQYGESTNGNPELLLDLLLTDCDNRRVTTALYFSAAAKQYSVERLRACGWDGADVSDLTGVDKNEISVEIRYEEYEGKSRMRAQILSGGGRFVSAKPVDPKVFAAKVGIVGAAAGNASGTRAPEEPPF